MVRDLEDANVSIKVESNGDKVEINDPIPIKRILR